MSVAPGTNIVRYSGNLSNKFWATNNLAVAPVSMGSPTGFAWRLIATGLEGIQSQYIAQTGLPEFIPNQTYTLSVWVKRENWPAGSQMMLWLIDQGLGEANGQSIGQVFIPDDNVQPLLPAADFSTQDLPVWSNVTGGVEYLAEGWQRIWVQGTSPNKPGAVWNVFLTTVGGDHGGVGSSFFCGGFSLVQGAAQPFAQTTSAPHGNDFLPLFDFPYHTVETRYPTNGTSVQFGNSYTFTAKASGPPQRVFALEFPALVWYVDDYTGQVDPITNAQMNAGSLDLFYQLVQLSDFFSYPHPMYGNVTVRFSKSLVIPASLPGGSGATGKLSIELLERPT